MASECSEERIAKLEKEIDWLKLCLGSLRDSTDKEVRGCDSFIDGVSKRVDELNDRVNKKGGKLSDQINGLQKQINNLTEGHNILVRRVNKLDSDVNSDRKETPTVHSYPKSDKKGADAPPSAYLSAETVPVFKIPVGSVNPVWAKICGVAVYVLQKSDRAFLRIGTEDWVEINTQEVK